MFDALNFVKIVEGDGVIGTRPIIRPLNPTHTAPDYYNHLLVQ